MEFPFNGLDYLNSETAAQIHITKILKKAEVSEFKTQNRKDQSQKGKQIAERKFIRVNYLKSKIEGSRSSYYKNGNDKFAAKSNPYKGIQKMKNDLQMTRSILSQQNSNTFQKSSISDLKSSLYKNNLNRTKSTFDIEQLVGQTGHRKLQLNNLTKENWRKRAYSQDIFDLKIQK